MGVNSSRNFINRAAVVRHSAEEGMTRVLLYIFRGRIRGNLERLGTRELDFMRRHRLVSCFPADGTPGHWRQKEEPVTDVKTPKSFCAVGRELHYNGTEFTVKNRRQLYLPDGLKEQVASYTSTRGLLTRQASRPERLRPARPSPLLTLACFNRAQRGAVRCPSSPFGSLFCGPSLFITQ